MIRGCRSSAQGNFVTYHWSCDQVLKIKGHIWVELKEHYRISIITLCGYDMWSISLVFGTILVKTSLWFQWEEWSKLLRTTIKIYLSPYLYIYTIYLPVCLNKNTHTLHILSYFNHQNVLHTWKYFRYLSSFVINWWYVLFANTC